MRQPTEAQAKEFWERYGFSSKTNTLGWDGAKEITETIVTDPNGLTGLSYPPINLITLFEYAMSEVDLWMLWNWKHKGVEGVGASIWQGGKKISEHTMAGKDPALALFWALWKVKEV